jgi:hypothetical protein
VLRARARGEVIRQCLREVCRRNVGSTVAGASDCAREEPRTTHALIKIEIELFNTLNHFEINLQDFFRGAVVSPRFMSTKSVDALTMHMLLQESVFSTMTPEEHRVFASILVASLPFPPLPQLLLHDYEELKKGCDNLVSLFDF